MQKRILALAAVAFAITLSSFTVQRGTSVYLTYSGTGDQRVVASYTAARPTTPPSHLATGVAILNWLQVIDELPAGVSNAEVKLSFDQYNITNPLGLSLNDEVDITNELDNKFAN